MEEMKAQEKKTQIKEMFTALKVMDFNEISNPGCYVILETGDLVRVHPEAVTPRRSLMISMHRRGTTRVAMLSDNDAELIPTLRKIATSNDILPNF